MSSGRRKEVGGKEKEEEMEEERRGRKEEEEEVEREEMEDLDLLVCLGFTSWQHLRSYHASYRFVTMCTHGNFIVLPHFPFSHIIMILIYQVLSNDDCQTR